MKSGMSALFQSILTPDTTLLGTLIEDVSQGTVPTNVDDSWTGIVPSVSGHSLPLEMAATISRQTAVKGQHGYGRISAPAIPISFTNPAANPNLLTGAAQTIYTTFYAGLQGTFTTASRTWNHVLSERPVKPAALVTKAGLVTSFLVRQVLGTARRRKIGRGV
jgi:hypothetical protein